MFFFGNNQFPRPPNNSNYPHSGDCMTRIVPGNVDMGSGYGMVLVHQWSCCGSIQRNSNSSTECKAAREAAEERNRLVTRVANERSVSEDEVNAALALSVETAAREAEERDRIARLASQRSVSEEEVNVALVLSIETAEREAEERDRITRERSSRERSAKAAEDRQRDARYGREIESKAEPPEEYICPILFEIMRDPVICADGFSYERVAIERWLQSHNTSPKTNGQLESRILIPNRNLKILIEEWKVENGIS